MNERYNHIDVEFAIWILNHPRRINEARVKEWLEDVDHKQLLEELRCIRQGCLESEEAWQPDPDAAWNSLNRKISGRGIVFMYRAVGAVACIVILLSMGWLWYSSSQRKMEPFVVSLPEIAQPAKGVTLVLNNGESVDLCGENEEKVEKKLTEVSNLVQIDPAGGIIYSHGKSPARQPGWHTLKVPRGGEYFVILDDGTKVWLNSETEIHYPVTFGERERVVDLIGEAYFQVQPDKKRPFIVRTNNLRTRVLGTEFNVQAYAADVENVTLVKGQVGVKSSAGKEDVILKPSENASYRGNKLCVAKVDVQKYISWKEGYFYYDNERLEDILDELGRWYDFEVLYENPDMKDLRFKFWAERKESFSKILERLKEMGKLGIKCTNNSVLVF